MEAPQIAYSERLVAFIDVMGFQSLLNARERGLFELQKYYDSIFVLVQEKSRFYGPPNENVDDFKWIVVSDAIVMSVKLPEGNQEARIRCCSKFFSAIRVIQRSLASEQDIWLRGAVSIGDLFMDDRANVLVGPAFVNAYNLEKTADYPRVIVDPRVFSALDLNPVQFCERVNKAGYPNLLLGRSSNRLGPGPYFSDAVQIDWFNDLIDRPGVNSELFFNGLKKRMSSNQELYEKSLKLGRYLRESYCRYLESGKARKVIDESLTELGF